MLLKYLNVPLLPPVHDLNNPDFESVIATILKVAVGRERSKGSVVGRESLTTIQVRANVLVLFGYMEFKNFITFNTLVYIHWCLSYIGMTPADVFR